MRIVKADTDLLRVPLGAGRGGSGATALDLVVTRVHVEDGEVGLGFTYSLNGGGGSILSLIEDPILPRLENLDILDWDKVWDELWMMTHRLGSGISSLAIAAVDIAVWDARAKAQKLPLYRLLGARRDNIAVYGSGRSTHSMSVGELIEGAQLYLNEGYRAIKLRVGAKAPEEDVSRVAAVRRAVGDDVRIMVDCNERLDYPTALWLGKRLEEYGIYWMEEPLPSQFVDSYHQLAQNLAVPIAAGEHLHNQYEFADYVRQGAASILMPDAPIVGGITEWMRIASTAAAFGVSVSPHFLPELHIHCALAAPNCVAVEHFPLIDDVLTESLVAEDGQMKPFDRPGHGIVFDPNKVEQFKIN